ncbi:MAG: tocopherol cyclase family protein, partial [Acidobacteriota bacterium]
GHFEVWFLTLNDSRSKLGFWFRYTLSAPFNSTDKPCAALWAAVFNPSAPQHNFGIRREYPIDQFSFDGAENFKLKISDGSFSPARAAGRIENGQHSVRWDLSFDPSEKTYNHITRGIHSLIRPSSFVCSPNLDVRFSGRVEVDGRTFYLEDAPGCQSHLWGRKQVDEWVWAHANAFEHHPESVFEGLAARPRVAGVTLLPVQSLFLRHRGEEHHFIRLRIKEQWRRHLGIGVWSFSAMNTRVYIEGTAQGRLKDMLQAHYLDPDGESLYCLNTEVANLKIRIFRRDHGIHWRHLETIKARSTAHLEHACRSADSSVKMAFED